jgi:signal transduction histidine kinase
MQVLANVLNNAVRSAKPSGSVAVAVAQDQNEVEVTVRDSGQGIPQEMIPKLFTKFSTGTLDGKGTGVGLFICKGIVQSHGGRIWGENNNDSKGATFGFTLPVKANSPQSEFSNK